MTFFSGVYQLLIGPIEIFYELIYSSFYTGLFNRGLTIIVLSLVMNFLLLPLYKRADAIQDAERQQEKDMADSVAHIKKTFSGDERFMMLQAYYRQNHYKPFYVLKGFLPLVLEIPFFIAAYNFLSNYQPLNGSDFGPIRDLGAPDGLLHIFGMTINAMPVLMTLINCISSAIYTKGYPLKDKLQLYGMALLFLVLLYDSPAGLVVYWTMNNLFSLIKNLVGRVKRGKEILKIVLAVGGIAQLIYGFHASFLDPEVPAVVTGALLVIPELFTLLGMAGKAIGKAVRKALASRSGKKEALEGAGAVGAGTGAGASALGGKTFLWSGLFLAVLTGMLIPSAVIVSSPAEFIPASNAYSPLRHILCASLLSFGLFVVWFGVFYWMFSEGGKRVFGKAVWAFAGVAIVNYMFFATDMGNLSAELYFVDRYPVFTAGQTWLNIGVLAAVIGLLLFVYHKKLQVARWAMVLLTAVAAVMSVVNMVSIQGEANEQREVIRQSEARRAKITLSKGGQNVVFIMLDRAIGSYVPYIFEEYPALKEQFAGFTYYPNTVSYGGYTNFGVPVLYGGYEYTPEEMNRRDDLPLEEKHDEALKVVPALFADAGYQVTVCDPPYAGYYWVPDLSIFDEYVKKYEGFATYCTEQGQFMAASDDELDQIWKRNFFCYSMMKTCPVVLQPPMYDNGYYFGTNVSHSQFDRSYTVLKALGEITETKETGNTFLSLCNSATHEPVRMTAEETDGLPQFEASEQWTFPLDDAHLVKKAADGLLPEIRLDTESARIHYVTNAAALIRLGKWLDELREMGVYDNTRIIIASDHGRDIGQFPQLITSMGGKDVDVMLFCSLLLVKDFGSTEYSVDEGLMTLADVPELLLRGQVENPVNPFTGKAIEKMDKDGFEAHILGSHNWSISINNGKKFEAGDWYSVHDDARDVANWRFLYEK